MSFTDKYANTFRKLLPAPFTIALSLTLIAFVCAVLLGSEEAYAVAKHGRILQTAEFWYQGLWRADGFQFAMQMMLMLLLGHVTALSKPVDSLLNRLTKYCTDNATSALILTFSTIVISLLNWGLGLVFGALFARKIAENASKNGIKINYGFIGACGYVGLMVWHGGISGSAPIKVADSGHIAQLMDGVFASKDLPDTIPMSATVFSSMNLVVTFALLLILPISMFFLGKKVKLTKLEIAKATPKKKNTNERIGMEKIDQSNWVGRGLGAILLAFSFYKIFQFEDLMSFRFLTPNFINFCLLGLALFMHRSIYRFLESIDQAIGGVSGILLQFPLYYGIMSIMIDSGLMESASDWMSSVASKETFPVFTFFSAGIMNVFVPSGGGQWVVQGPIIVKTAINSGIALDKCVMAMAYGDQLTNMMQPFWALPLLGITGLKAKEILPYTLVLMLIGSLIFLAGILLF